MYVSIQYGDRLPTVALAQSLLVAHGFDVPIDGHFGQRTREAVSALQRRRGIPTTATNDGVIHSRTWNALSATGGDRQRALRVLEEIDGSDDFGAFALCAPRMHRCGPDEAPVSRAARNWVNDGHAVVHVEREGGSGLFDRIAARNTANSVDLLRFVGHATPGRQSLTWNLSFDHTTIASSAMQSSLAKLARIMRPTGSIELHGCNTGMGGQGRRLLQGIADVTRVPVSAGRQLQYAGPTSNRFSGSVQTCCPGRRSLADWARSVFGASR